MSGNIATSLVQFTQFSGLELNAHLVVEEKSARQKQKLITLSQYVQKYPQGKNSLKSLCHQKMNTLETLKYPS
jgi:hypothetical protein